MRAHLILLIIIFSSIIYAEDIFIIEDIEVSGLRGISAGTLFTYLPLNIGDEFSTSQSGEILRALYQTGFFADIKLARRGNILVIQLSERPIIGEIKVSGNRKIKKKELNDALKQAGLVQGEIFNPALLEAVEAELQQVYFNFGQYGIEVKSNVEELSDNRVAIAIDIFEGAVAKIESINIIGNKDVTDKKLIKLFKSGSKGFLGFFSNRQYSKPILESDLEKLRSYYQDRGYLQFKVNSTQVSITPNKKSIYIDINITEGEVFTVEEVAVTGELVVPQEELEALIEITPGDTFSRKTLTKTVKAMENRLADDGYAFAKVNILPEEIAPQQVKITFSVSSGQRMYVRRIEFLGNYKTEQETLRRELRQLEGAWFSNEKVERSRVRLQRLSFIGSVNVETKPVSGTNDQLDLLFNVEERFSGNLLVGLGFSQAQGILFDVNVTQNNFLGSGKRLSLIVNNSSSRQNYSISYVDPYYTIDGVSRGFRLFYRSLDADKEDIDNYLADVYGTGLIYGIPISEFTSVRFNLDYQHTEIETGSDTAESTLEFLEDNGDTFNSFNASVTWSYDTRNRVIFPDQGTLQSINTEVALPIGDLEYYKVNYDSRYYYALTEDVSLSIKGELGYGNSYSDTTELPFFEKFYLGGINSVRGFEASSLGPRDGDTGDPIGGAFKVYGGAEVVFPATFLADKNTLRLSAFIDVGNVFDDVNDFETVDLRVSTGLGAIWFTPIGVLKFSYGIPLNSGSNDDLQAFQFAIGTTF